MDLLKWARENGCPWNVLTCVMADLYGHLKVLQWARDNSCPWESDTCSEAAQAGHLDVSERARGTSRISVPITPPLAYSKTTVNRLSVIMYENQPQPDVWSDVL